MSERDPHDIDLLITRHLDGELVGEDAQALQRWLRADRANVDVFVRRMIDHQRLHELTAVTPMVQVSEDLELIDEPLGGVHSPNEGTDALLHDLLALEQEQAESEPVDITERVLEERLAARRAKARRQQRFRSAGEVAAAGPQPFVISKPVAWLGVAAVLGLLASVVWFNRPAERVTNTTPPTADRVSPPVSQPDRPVQVAVVSAALDAYLADGRPLEPGTVIYNAPLDLAEGIVKLELTSGVTLTLEGPATLDPGSDMFVELDQGKLVGYVPEQAHGFVVRTPTMDVVDLGTEFGIAVDAQRGGQVHVIDGSVRVEPGRYAQSFEPRVAGVGDAMAVEDEGALETVPARPGTFYREVPVGYERMVRDAGPVAYWRFGTSDTPDQAAGHDAHLTALRGTGPMDLRRDTPFAGDPGDRSLWLDVDAPLIHSAATIDLDTTGPFTIESWVWVPSSTEDRMRIVSNNELDAGLEHVGGLGFGVTGQTDRRAGGPVLFFTGFARFDAYSTVAVPTDRWTHVAVTLDGRGGIALWIDGREVPCVFSFHQGSGGQVAVVPLDRPMRLGDAMVAGAIHAHEKWVGGIDELAIYSRVLDAAEIASHADPGRSLSTHDRPAR